MHSFVVAALATFAAIPAVSAHGYVSGVVSGGKWYVGGSPNWIYESTKPKQAGWFAYNQDLGFVPPDEYSSPNITCHKGGTPGTTSIPVAAGSKIELEWTAWPSSHHGPILNYLARCDNGDCTTVNKNDLHFFKVEAEGLINDNPVPGTWADDKMIANNNTATLTIPSDISGDFVLRHEIIALHSAETVDGAQNYPMCINLKISGSGTTHPCKQGADCVVGTKLYKEKDPGILVDIYTTLKSYKMPGPSVWSGFSKAKRVAQVFSA